MPDTRTSLVTPVLIVGSIFVLISFAIRASFGVFQIPTATEFGCLRADFSMAIATAAGSAGQVFGAPTAQALLNTMPWQSVFLIFAAVILSTLLILPLMRIPPTASKAQLQESMGQILVKAFKDPSCSLIFVGFFSCGYQLAFMIAHFPALATVPLTSGLIAHIYGPRFMGTLYGIIFFSHQLGSFMGVWLGRRLYNAYGTYTIVWWVGIAVDTFSALVHLPVREKPLQERAARDR